MLAGSKTSFFLTKRTKHTLHYIHTTLRVSFVFITKRSLCISGHLYFCAMLYKNLLFTYIDETALLAALFYVQTQAIPTLISLSRFFNAPCANKGKRAFARAFHFTDPGFRRRSQLAVVIFTKMSRLPDDFCTAARREPPISSSRRYVIRTAYNGYHVLFIANMNRAAFRGRPTADA